MDSITLRQSAVTLLVLLKTIKNTMMLLRVLALLFQKFRQKLANRDVTKEALFIAADSIVDAISFIRLIVL